MVVAPVAWWVHRATIGLVITTIDDCGNDEEDSHEMDEDPTQRHVTQAHAYTNNAYIFGTYIMLYIHIYQHISTYVYVCHHTIACKNKGFKRKLVCQYEKKVGYGSMKKVNNIGGKN